MSLYAAGKKAPGICDICGRRYKLNQLKQVTKNRVPTSLRACPECWDPPHPQDDLGLYRVQDAQARENPRPDTSEHATSRAAVFQLPQAVGVGRSGAITVS